MDFQVPPLVACCSDMRGIDLQLPAKVDASEPTRSSDSARALRLQVGGRMRCGKRGEPRTRSLKLGAVGCISDGRRLLGSWKFTLVSGSLTYLPPTATLDSGCRSKLSPQIVGMGKKLGSLVKWSRCVPLLVSEPRWMGFNVRCVPWLPLSTAKLVPSTPKGFALL